MGKNLELPIIDLSTSDSISAAKSIRQACIECGFFYLINHGVEENLFRKVLEQNKLFFSLPLEEKMKLSLKENRGYTLLYGENLDPSSSSRGDSKETFYVGPLEDMSSLGHLNQWPPKDCWNNRQSDRKCLLSQVIQLELYEYRTPDILYGSPEFLPSWRSTMEDYYKQVLNAGEKLISLIALALNLEESFFYDIGALSPPNAFLRLLHYPGELGASDEEIYGASAHSDYGMITLLATDGVGGLQVCREKLREPREWEDVQYVTGSFIVNIGDMMERWTNCLFRSTLHRVMPTGQERYSMAFFMDPNPDCLVECLKSCCDELSPPRFPPIRSGDYLEERFKLAYASSQ